MDTNAKNYRYSPAAKWLCVILCFITALSGCLLTTGVACTMVHSSEQSDFYYDYWDWTEDYGVASWIYEGVLKGVDMAHFDLDELEKLFESRKTKACDSIYKKISNNVTELKEAAGEERIKSIMPISLADLFASTSDYISVETYYSVGTDYSCFLNLSDNEQSVSDTDTEFSFSLDEYSEITVGNYEEKLYSAIESKYDSFVSIYIYNCQNREYNTVNGLYYRVEKNGKLVDSNTTMTAEEIAGEKYSFTIKDGKATSKSIAKSTLDRLFNLDENRALYPYTDLSADDYVLYCYIDARGPNRFSEIKEEYSLFAKINEHIFRYACIAAVLVVLSFALGFSYFGVVGQKSREEKARLIFIDYIPFELQLAVVGAGGVGLGSLFFNEFDSLYEIKLMILLAAACFFVAWLLLFELSCSVSRYAKSEKKFYRHLLIYWILRAVYKLPVLIFKWLKKLFKSVSAIIGESVSIMKYRPRQLGKKFTLFFVCWIFLNLIIVLITGFFQWIYSDFPTSYFSTVIGALVGVIANAAMMRPLIKYIKQLDVIIDSSSQHIDIPLALDTMPESLRLLSESMKYTNLELQQAIEKAIKDERLRAELITNVSHDLKTPLTSIITYVELLKQCDINDPKANEYIKVIDEKGKKLKRLIEDLIEASKVTSGNINIELSPMNLSELCLQSTIEAQRDFEKAGLELVVKQGENVIINADGSKTFRVIENLLSNAKKYSLTGTRVYVNVFDDGENGVFEIKNTSAEMLDISPDELTERFVRGDKSRSKEGNGLGLSIAKELCKAQKGKLSISIDGDLFKARVSFPKV